MRTYRARITRPCAVCEGSGYVGVQGHPDLTAVCPGYGCYFGEVHPLNDALAAEVMALTIGKVDVTVESRGRESLRPPAKVVRYMAWETGVGSGTSHHEENLYDSHEAAVAAADAAGAEVQP